jgi:predicted nucleotidyltransferase/transcriptional regulator with XRE-family HTH domain
MGLVLKLRELRRLRGLTQKEVARLSGIGVKTISSFETGERIGSLELEQLERLLEVYGRRGAGHRRPGKARARHGLEEVRHGEAAFDGVRIGCDAVPRVGTIVPGMGIRSSLADALFSATQQRVLGLLYGHPDRSFFATEIFERVGSGRGTVQRELERLVDSGLAVMTRVGNQKHYRANREAPIFSELRSIVLKTSGLAEPLREALAPLAKKIELALVYGSVARGDAHAGSDVDLLVVARDLTLAQLYTRLLGAEKATGRKINPTLLTPVEFCDRRAEGNPFLKKVLSGDTIALIGSAHDAP